MTLVVAVTGPEAIWLLADRRLSCDGRPPKDDGRKVMFLETIDGVAILGYAGLGATARGTEPADWMSAVLRGRNLPLENSLGVLAEAIQNQLPRHMIQMRINDILSHHVIIPAFLGNEPRLYSIDLAFGSDRKNYRFRYTRHANTLPTGAFKTPSLGIGGSGALYLLQHNNWQRDLLRVVSANERGKISLLAVADHLARLNARVHQAMLDKSVGSRCVVAWRFRKGGFHNGGGGHQFYTGLERETSCAFLPTISTGMDMVAVGEVFMTHSINTIKALLAGEAAPKLDKDAINAALAGLPHLPDETLR